MMRGSVILAAAVMLAGAAEAAAPGGPAILRPMVTLTAPIVRLSDLFDDAGPQADRVLGPGPAPGARIVVEAPQLAAIAQQFGVPWQPASSADRAILERHGRLLPQAEVLEAIKEALVAAGAGRDCDVDLQGFSPPVVAEDSSARTGVEQLDQDPASGRFTATIAVFSDGLPPQRMRVGGRVEETEEVPVATRRLLAGTLLHDGDVRVSRVRVGLMVTEVAHDEGQVVGRVLRHLILPGQPFPRADLARQALVSRNARVRMALNAPGLELSGQGLAMEAGALGDQIPVLNPTSRQVMQAEVVGPNSVRVAPGAAPVAAAGREPPPLVAQR